MSAAGLPPQASYECALALVEAVDNAIIHAHKRRENKLIDIGISVRKHCVLLEIGDNGGGFRLENIKEPIVSQITGRGIYLIKAMMDRVEYKKNVLRMEYGY